MKKIYVVSWYADSNNKMYFSSEEKAEIFIAKLKAAMDLVGINCDYDINVGVYDVDMEVNIAIP